VSTKFIFEQKCEKVGKNFKKFLNCIFSILKNGMALKKKKSHTKFKEERAVSRI
jgi:hypothetical protein